MSRKSERENQANILMDTNIPFVRNQLLQLIIVVFILYWGAMAFAPTDRSLWLIESILPVAVSLVLAFTYKKFRFSNLSYLFMFIFLCLHTFAAHYTYQNTPFDEWLKAAFHTKRSYFDRVVHLTFGLFWTYPFRELLTRAARLRSFWSYAVPAAVVISLSATFEIIEFVVALIAGQSGQNYVGLQGDIFDTQKDMALNFIGAIVSMGLLAWMMWRREK